jgi:two-component system sensor histidine kinase RegB
MLVTFFLAKLHQRLQQQQQALQQAQLEGQSQQHLLNMSLAAASTAHELSTPLATISLLAAEAADAYRYQEPDNAAAALAQIHQLVGHCKTQISASLKQHHLERSERLSLLSWSDYLDSLLTQWKTLRPQVKVVLTISGDPKQAPQPINLPILSQSITSLLNNACEASPEPLQLQLNWNEQQVCLCLHNQGKGFSEALLAQFPQPQLSDKTDGHGVGLALAHANIQQLGGQLVLSNPEAGGAQACIIMPTSIEKWQLRQNVALNHSLPLS